jgi:hypothetical protein
LFLALLGMCETNALKAYRRTVGPMTRYAWLCKLSHALVNNPFVEGAEAQEAGPSNRIGTQCGNMVYFEHHRKCANCGVSTHWMCLCGYAVCRAGHADTKGKQAAKCDGYFRHIAFGEGAR